MELGIFHFSAHTGLVAPQRVRPWCPGQGRNPRGPPCRAVVSCWATRDVPREEPVAQKCTSIAWRPGKNSPVIQEVWGGPRDAVFPTSSPEDSLEALTPVRVWTPCRPSPRAPQHVRPAALAGQPLPTSGPVPILCRRQAPAPDASLVLRVLSGFPLGVG